MNKDHFNLSVKLAGAFLLTGVATAEQDTQSYYIDSKNSLSLSMRFGLNISGKFLGTGGSSVGYDHGARTPNGDPYNFDNGYVLTDISGNSGNQTVYYGYDSSSQITGVALVQQYLNLDRTTTSGIGSGGNDTLNDPRIGAELTYNHELGIKENWHHMRFGFEMAANYTPVSFHNTIDDENVTATTTTYTYAFAPGVSAPSAPFQGTYDGAGPTGSPYAILGATPTIASSTLLGGKFLAQQDFKGDLWGFRVGPYIELPITRKLSAHLSGGLAVGLLDDSAAWSESITLPGGGGTTTHSGGGDDLSALWGEYVRLDFSWQFNQHWGAEIGAQFQDLGRYDHNFGGRTVELDLSKSIFVEAGISYSF